MKHIVTIILMAGIMSLCGCSSEKATEPVMQLPAVSLASADKEKLMAFQKDFLSVGNLAETAVKLAGDELKNVIKGGGAATNLASLIDKAKSQCLLTGESLAKKTVPEALPPEMKALLSAGNASLIEANKAYGELFDAIRSFTADKNPMALLKCREKLSQAQGLYKDAGDKFKTVMTAAGVSE